VDGSLLAVRPVFAYLAPCGGHEKRRKCLPRKELRRRYPGARDVNPYHITTYNYFDKILEFLMLGVDFCR